MINTILNSSCAHNPKQVLILYSLSVKIIADRIEQRPNISNSHKNNEQGVKNLIRLIPSSANNNRHTSNLTGLATFKKKTNSIALSSMERCTTAIITIANKNKNAATS